MVSSVWTGYSQDASATYTSGNNAATSTVPLVWHAPLLAQEGVTVSAQAALSYYSTTNEGGPTGPLGSARAVISSYRRAPLGSPFVPVNEPTLNNVENVLEIVFELTVSAFAGGPYNRVDAIMVGTVFIQ